MLLLLAEDETSKRDRLHAFLVDAFPGAKVEFSKSVRSTLDALQASRPDILLLDMSLPTFDIAAGEPGGRPQGFGGIEVIRYLERDEINVPTIVVTQHPAIPKDGKMVSLADLENMIKAEMAENFCGLVYYNTVTGGWKKDLLAAITAVFEKSGTK